MLHRVREAAGESFRPAQAYRDDLSPLWEQIGRFDKFERLQHFRQPEDASWRAFAAGRWKESLELKELERPVVEAEFAEDARLGYNSYRVRVVELPVTPYLQWELEAFTIRVECGEKIRIVGPEAVARYETIGTTPELIFMGSLAMYEVLYDDTGVLTGGRKLADPELIAGWPRFILSTSGARTSGSSSTARSRRCHRRSLRRNSARPRVRELIEQGDPPFEAGRRLSR